MAVVGPDFIIIKLGVGPALIFVITELELDILLSPPPITVAELVTIPVMIGFTVSTMLLLPLITIVLLLVHVTVCPFAVHDHPLPLPLTKVSPAGITSVTVIGPAFVVAVPVLLTVSV